MIYINLNEMRKLAGLPLKEDYDAKQSDVESQKIVKLLKDRFSVPVETKRNSDGSRTITVNNGYMAPDKESSNPHAITVKNLSSAIDDLYREYRRKGWVFSQPVRGSFTVGVPL